MYFLALSGMQWYDTVVWSTLSWYRPGDLLKDNDIYFLCLWKEIVFTQLYKKQLAKEHSFMNPEKAYKQLVSTKTLDIIHWMVKEYFSSYKHVAGLFIPTWLENRLPKKPIKRVEWPQKCIIFPDLRTLSQTYPVNTLPDDTAILHWWMTQVQKAKLYRGVWSGSIKTLLSTNRWLFFDRVQLDSIIVYSPTNRAYSGQSEPRFVIKETAEKIAEIYGSKIEYRA